VITCREFVDFLMQYLDRELVSEQSEAFESHIRDCPPCGVYLDQYRDTIALGKMVCRDPEGPVPEEVPEELVNAILAARSRSGS